jgi:4,5-DOPA dioxygenase extradiol
MLPSLFLSHGSPMLPLTDEPARHFLAALPARLERPRAILVASAHWETARPTLTAGPANETIHDFYGFPRPLYELTYPAPGAPSLALEVAELLRGSGLDCGVDNARGLDHGAWVPLSLMYPAADIPVVQLSLPSRLGPAMQERVGKALRQLRVEGYLLIGSGSITHNLGELDWHAGPEVIAPWAKAFRDWMVEKLVANDDQALLDYRRQAPSAVRNHPRDEHLLPLYFAHGAGGPQLNIEHSGFTLGALGMDIYRFG